MFKYTNAFTNRSGDALPGYFAKLFDADGNAVDIFADASSTPISTVSGVANAALSDENGMFRWHVANGTYDIRFYDANDVFVSVETGVSMFEASAAYLDLEVIAARVDDDAAAVAADRLIVADDAAQVAIDSDQTAIDRIRVETIANTGVGRVIESWAVLDPIVGVEYDGAIVPDTDTGDHTDPDLGSVPNAGAYRYTETAPAGWRWIAGSAVLNAGVEADRAEAARAGAEAAQTATADVRGSALVQGVLPIGWVEPNDFTGVGYATAVGRDLAADYGVKFYSSSLKIWPMMPDSSATLSGWRVAGAPRVRHPDDGLYYVGVSVARIKDPTAQGVSVTQYYVNNSTGDDTTGDGSSGTPWKTVEKAITTINDAADGVYQVNVETSTFIGGNSAGWNNASRTIAAGKKVKFYGAPMGDGSKPWWLPGMRNAYTKATFAWSNIGDGWWKCTTGSISAAAKNTSLVFDLSVLDPDGMPTPSEALTGTLEDDAAVKAAGAGKPSFYYRSSDTTLYVKLASGLEPDPGVNFAYCELVAGGRFDIAETGRVMVENFRVVHNGGASSSSVVMSFRPLTYTIGSTAPVVVHDIEAVAKDVEVYGSSGNGFDMLSVTRWVIEDCKDGYCWLDGVNSHSLYSPGNSNDPLIGSAQHTFIDGHVSLYHGPNGFKGQSAVNSSSNTITDHDRGNTTAINCPLGFSNGSGVAIVGGAKCLLINVNSHSPKLVTPATDTYTSPFLASGNSPYSTAIGSEIWAIHSTGMVRPNADAKMFYVSTNAKMVAAHFRGVVTKSVSGTGTLTDGYGNNL